MAGPSGPAFLFNFYPRSPCGERLYDTYAKVLRVNISIHALLAESDACIMTITTCTVLFLSTLSLRRATSASFWNSFPIQHFYPRSPCGERPDNLGTRFCEYCISIHALLAESDIRNAEAVSKYMIFLSTLSLRRATKVSVIVPSGSLYFYPRSPCGERHYKTRK